MARRAAIFYRRRVPGIRAAIVARYERLDRTWGISVDSHIRVGFREPYPHPHVADCNSCLELAALEARRTTFYGGRELFYALPERLWSEFKDLRHDDSVYALVDDDVIEEVREL